MGALRAFKSIFKKGRVGVQAERAMVEAVKVVDSAKNVAHVRWGTWIDLPRVTVDGIELGKLDSIAFDVESLFQNT
jgi:hypothetical protein